MALTDMSPFHLPMPNPAELAKAPPVPQFVLPQAALVKLPVLYDEAVRATRLTRLLAHGIQAAWLLIGSAAVTLAFGGRSLPENFAWCLLLFIGVIAVVRTYMKGFALKRGPVEALAADLRASLLYAGFAWGAGAFLVLPVATDAWALTNFAALPMGLMALLLRDRGATLLFGLPVAAFCISAACLDVAGGIAGAIGVILATGAIIIVTVLVTNRRTGTIPAGLALR